MGPAVHLHDEVGELHLGEPLGDLPAQGPRALGGPFVVVAGEDELALLDPDLAAAGHCGLQAPHRPLHLLAACGQVLGAILGGAGKEAHLLPERGPLGLGYQEALWVGVSARPLHPHVPRPQGAPQLPKEAHLPVAAVHNAPAARERRSDVGEPTGRREAEVLLPGRFAALLVVQLLQAQDGVQQGVACLVGAEAQGLEHRRGELPDVVVLAHEEVVVVVVQGPHEPLGLP